MLLNIMGGNAIQDYIAKILVFSEVFSVIQATINVHGGEVSYFNLIVFFILGLPFLFRGSFTINEIMIFLLFCIFLLLKIIFQGVGEYFQKAVLLLLLLPFYLAFAKQTSMVAIAAQCYKYRKLILIFGLVYVVSWFFWGTYRSASTVTVFIMLLLAYKNVFGLICSTLFALVMKTQYKIWLLVAVGSAIYREGILRRTLLVLMGFGAVYIPIVLAYTDSSLLIFNDSQLSSLEERLREVRAFISLIGTTEFFWILGWPIGQAIEYEGLSDRGYMHSAYLWILGTTGVAFSIFLFIVICAKGARCRKYFFIRAFLVLANAFTFLFLTNPICTILMLADERKKNV